MTSPRAAIASLLLLILCPAPLRAAQPLGPTLSVSIDGADPQALPATLHIVALMTILTLAPALVIMVTSFTRILIVLSFTRSALGTQQIPPNIVLAGMALFLTIFTMAPVWQEVDERALQPYLQGTIGYEDAAARAVSPVRAFMLRQTPEADLALFVSLGKLPRPATSDDLPTYVIIPAFMVGELKRAFTMGFMIFIPFVVIDMVIATMLMSMGMMMMPPVVISLPCKIMLFVLVNGWHVVTESVVASFR
ncbi:MAG TPA: flagellar type III secretion system pore protein FliP [Armatimonadota bacterium]|nr:flagellar type III secretion system pore protein FliP [Armatimonadota bacterium]